MAAAPLPFRPRAVPAVEPAALDDVLLLDIPEAARRLHLSQRTVYSLIARGSLRAVTVVGKLRIRPGDLAAFVARLT
jgi:excisionase family DNA binding protein